MHPLLASLFLLTAHDILIADFERSSYGGWRVEGKAFGPGPAAGTLLGQMVVSGYRGKRLVNTYFGGDESTGTLTSPEFKIERRFIRFLIGGGKDLERTFIALLVDGKVLRLATGPNDKPGGSEALEPGSWGVAELRGRTARIRIVDQSTGGWGHINVDEIAQTDKQPPELLTNVHREFAPPGRYLMLPIKNGATKRLVTLLVDGKEVVRNDIELADGKPDWWAAMDLGSHHDQTVSLQVDHLLSTSDALRTITRRNSLKLGSNLYREALRGQFHFSPMRGWNNDPNGLVYYKGEYHVFFQHNPYGWGWGNMHWGHAVSNDLVCWQEVGDALAPDDLGPMYSGSAVVDWQNSSGLGSARRPPLVLIYTAAGDPSVQCLASSTDGRNFVKYSGNPVVTQFSPGNRDPKVMWHEPTKKWVMVLYVETAKGHTIRFLTSPNLKEWTTVSEIEGLLECPDLFELPLDGDLARSKWILTAASSEYLVGTFDGTKFTAETPKLRGHQGKGFYAAQTFSDIPREDGRRIQIGWFQTETKGMPFNQSMTVPLELRLVSTPVGPRLSYRPAKELATLRTEPHRLRGLRLVPGSKNPLAAIRAELVELNVEFEPEAGSEIVFAIRGASVAFDAESKTLVVNGHPVAAPLIGGRQRLKILCDRTGLEVFASDGLVYVPMPFLPKTNDLKVVAKVTKGSVTLANLELFPLKSAWPSR